MSKPARKSLATDPGRLSLVYERRLFTRQLSALVGAGVNIVPALEAVQKQAHPLCQPMLVQLCRQLDSGRPFSEVLRGQGSFFPGFYVSMVRVGEQTGQLHAMLDRLNDWLDADDRLSRQLRSSLTYPALVISLGGLLFFSLIYWVLPGFLTILREQPDLPLPTRALMGLSDFLHGPGLLLILIMTGLTALGLRRYFQTSEGKRELQVLLLRIPFLGEVLAGFSLARYSLAMQSMQASGLNLLACLELSAEVSGHALIQEDLPALKDHVQSGGEPWSWFHSHPELYPPVFTQMVRVGSQVARLDTIFGWLANHFEVRAQYRAQEFVKLLEPALLLCMGMALAAVLASLFIPLYGMLGK